MCGGVEYTHKGDKVTTYFPNPKAHLPVRTRNGGIKLIAMRWNELFTIVHPVLLSV